MPPLPLALPASVYWPTRVVPSFLHMWPGLLLGGGAPGLVNPSEAPGSGAGHLGSASYAKMSSCLLFTSYAADEIESVNLRCVRFL